MKFGINLNEASTKHGFIKLAVATIGMIMIYTSHGSDVSTMLLLVAGLGLEGAAKVTMPDDQS